MDLEVILLKDIKGKGKKEDVIKVSSGYGNFLIKSKSAKLATDGNVKHLNEEQERRALEEQKHLEEMESLKSKIEKQMLEFQLKSGNDGRIFGSINSKQIAEQMFKQCGINVDKKKIDLKENIKNIGQFSASIKLHKKVSAKIKIVVKSE